MDSTHLELLSVGKRRRWGWAEAWSSLVLWPHAHQNATNYSTEAIKKIKKDPVIGIRPATPTSVSPFSFGVQVSQFLRFKAWFLELLAKGIWMVYWFINVYAFNFETFIYKTYCYKERNIMNIFRLTIFFIYFSLPPFFFFFFFSSSLFSPQPTLTDLFHHFFFFFIFPSTNPHWPLPPFFFLLA